MAGVDLSHHPVEKLPFQVFRQAIEARLETCSTEELRAILRTLADRVRPSERMAFLESLTHPSTSARGQVRQDALLEDITELARRLTERMDKADTGEEDWPEEDILGPYAELLDPLTALSCLRGDSPRLLRG